MRKTAILFGVLIATSSPISAMALENHPTNPPTHVGTRKNAQPLTVNECKGLGGTVQDVGTQYCSLGLECKIEATGKELCITERE